jgi:hypothetical protein
MDLSLCLETKKQIEKSNKTDRWKKGRGKLISPLEKKDSSDRTAAYECKGQERLSLKPIQATFPVLLFDRKASGLHHQSILAPFFWSLP